MLTNYVVFGMINPEHTCTVGGFSLAREVITMTFSELIQFVIMLIALITLVHKITKDYYSKK